MGVLETIDLDDKINEHFQGLVVRKDLVNTVKGNAIVPSYVLEYLLGQYCATNDEASIESGIETVKKILTEHYVHRNEAGLIKSKIKEKGKHKVIDRISVSLNEKDDCYEASFANLGINKVLVDSMTIKAHPKLLVSGVWCIADLEYEYTEDKKNVPWVLASIKPIQLSGFDYNQYIEARKKFSTDEWIDLLIQSIGFNPEMFSKRGKLTQLIRLIPFCERNYNLIELGPKGTGKSHIYSEFSPHGILLSGGEVTVAKLFVNNSSGKIGLVGYWDTVAFDEFAGKQKKSDKALVDILKNYMANKSFSRGVETLGAEASMVFVGNTSHTVPYMLKHSDLFDDLPEKFHDSAFIDRVHFYIPGWEIDIIRAEMYSNGYGFVVDYLAEILRHLRAHDYSDRYSKFFDLSPTLSTRDKNAVNKTFSGLMKIIFPDGEASEEEINELLAFSIEGRKRVKDQLFRIDQTYAAVDFYYEKSGGGKFYIKTTEEKEYPNYYNKTISDDALESADEVDTLDSTSSQESTAVVEAPIIKEIELKEQTLTFEENQKGVTYEKLLASYLKGAKIIQITDPFIRMFYQANNLMDLMEVLAKNKRPEDEIVVHLITTADEYKFESQQDFLTQIQEACVRVGIQFTFEFDNSGKLHARYIQANNGWKIILDRGLDIYQPFDAGNAFCMARRMPESRKTKSFYVTYTKEESN
jgi:ATP-dependent Lon protease